MPGTTWWLTAAVKLSKVFSPSSQSSLRTNIDWVPILLNVKYSSNRQWKSRMSGHKTLLVMVIGPRQARGRADAPA